MYRSVAGQYLSRGSAMLQGGLSIVGSVADALTRGGYVPGLESTGLVWGAVAIGSVGALLLLGLIGRRPVHVPGAGRTVRAALPLLPPDVQSAVATALRAQEAERTVPPLGAERAGSTAGPRVRAAVPAAVPPYLFVVRQDQSNTFSSLRDLAWSRPDLLGVTFDRRWMGDRRCKREPGRAERRCAERRRDSVERSWTRHGFVLVRPAVPPRSLPAAPVRPVPRPTAAVAAGPTTTVKPAASPRPTVTAGAPIRPRAARRGIWLGIGALLAVIGVGAALLYFELLDQSVVDVTRSAVSLEAATPVLPPPLVPPVIPGPSSPARAVEKPAVAPPSPGSTPSTPARREPAALVTTPAAPPEPARSAGVPADRCVTPEPAAVALLGREVLGPVVGVRIDADASPPRCLYVVDREGGVQWVVDSARVQLRPQ
jgi:hypothetical protein